ncbi:MAG: tetratricopeptide repeat protein [Clostridia bacterium]|nr:tetratricopeptide repeat protein [Clostridia bacterium]
MDNRKKEKSTVWVYAVVLFTSAFVVLLLTAYSQIKFNKNISYFRNQISIGEKEKLNFQTNLSSALDENKKLRNEIIKLTEEYDNYKQNDEIRLKEIEKLKKEISEIKRNFEGLLEAEKAFNEGDKVKCALILHKLETSYFNNNAREKFNVLSEKSINPAALELYINGLSNYKSNNYSVAIEKFKLSLTLTDAEYFSDDCLYFIGYCQYKLGSNDEAKKTFTTLLERYSNSSYKREVEQLLRKF